MNPVLTAFDALAGTRILSLHASNQYRLIHRDIKEEGYRN
jgi:hypothetical protein